MIDLERENRILANTVELLQAEIQDLKRSQPKQEPPPPPPPPCCTECEKAKARRVRAEWRRKNADRIRSKRHKEKGLPEPTRPCPDFCECCGRPPGDQRLALDHCHETGEFRGWLCWQCNTAIGHLGDNGDGVGRALRYLQRFEEKLAA